MVGMIYLDLFSGIGGFSLGLKRAGFSFTKHYNSEIDKYASAIYRKNFPESVNLGSIVNIRPEHFRCDMPNLITFGFPCQDLSLAGQRKGFSGKRSSLFFEAMRIIEFAKPEIFIFENVTGLFSSEEGRDFEAVLRAVADLGLYECEWQLVNTRWVLPQNRARVYFVGHLAGKSRPKVFPITEGRGISAQGSDREREREREYI